MSKKEKRWRVFYVILMLFAYIIGIPLFLFGLFSEGDFSFGFVVFAIALPFIRKSHLKQMQKKTDDT